MRIVISLALTTILVATLALNSFRAEHLPPLTSSAPFAGAADFHIAAAREHPCKRQFTANRCG
jgi:hypothetical protein